MSERNPAKDPLVLWLKCALRCRDLACAALTHVPSPYAPAVPVGAQRRTRLQLYRRRLPQRAGAVLSERRRDAAREPVGARGACFAKCSATHRCRQAWSRTANMLFLDSPAFVGFSYSNSSADKKVGDARTASDSRLFLLGFLQKFPGFATTPLYIAGESYAGHYIPNLAAAILAGNAAGTGHLNLQGVMIGNAWTDAPTDNLGAAVHWWCVPALWISQLACVAR